MLLLWAILLQCFALMAEVQQPNLGDLVDRPEIRLYPHYIGIEEWPTELKKTPEYDSALKAVEESIKKEDFDEAYVSLVRFLDKHPNYVLVDWLSFVRADLLLRVQNKIEGGKLSLALEEYELVIRQYPLHAQVPRALYQMALIKLYSGLYQEAEVVVQRALSEYPQSIYVPEYYLINAEQYFLAKNYENALPMFELIVSRYPRHIAAVDAAFRKAFLHFMKKDYQKALATYQNLENFHAAEFNILRMKAEASTPKKLQDRLFYGEVLYLTGKYEDASIVLQNLANLFPKHPNAAFAWIRYADTFFARERYLAAQKLYEYVLHAYSGNKKASAWARIRLFDALQKNNRMRYDLEVEEALRRAQADAESVESIVLAELAQVKLVQYFLSIGSFPKAQRVLKDLKFSKEALVNSDWIQSKFIEVLEKEILDYYHSEDLLAALTTYLVNEEDTSVKFNNVQVLIRIADAARELDLLDKSEEILNRVVYLESSSMARQEALLKLIQLLIHKKDLRKASERLRRFNFAYPSTSLKYLYEKSWGDLYRELKKPDQAVEHYEESLRLAATQAGGLVDIRHTYVRLGELYSQLSLPLKAVESYGRYLGMYADSERVQLGGIPMTKKDEYYLKLSRYRIADLYFNMKDYIQALAAYRKVSEEVKEEPFRSHSLYRIGECYLALDDREAAIEAFKKVKSDDQNNLWLRAAQAYIQSVEMEVKNGIRIFN